MRADTGEILSPAEYEITGEVKAPGNRTRIATFSS